MRRRGGRRSRQNGSQLQELSVERTLSLSFEPGNWGSSASATCNLRHTSGEYSYGAKRRAKVAVQGILLDGRYSGNG